jgi:hypothetical protein
MAHQPSQQAAHHFEDSPSGIRDRNSGDLDRPTAAHEFALFGRKPGSD